CRVSPFSPSTRKGEVVGFGLHLDAQKEPATLVPTWPGFPPFVWLSQPPCRRQPFSRLAAPPGTARRYPLPGIPLPAFGRAAPAPAGAGNRWTWGPSGTPPSASVTAFCLGGERPDPANCPDGGTVPAAHAGS